MSYCSDVALAFLLDDWENLILPELQEYSSKEKHVHENLDWLLSQCEIEKATIDVFIDGKHTNEEYIAFRWVDFKNWGDRNISKKLNCLIEHLVDEGLIRCYDYIIAPENILSDEEITYRIGVWGVDNTFILNRNEPGLKDYRATLKNMVLLCKKHGIPEKDILAAVDNMDYWHKCDGYVKNILTGNL